ncbi:hypothetical protein FACS1894200_13060 [Spirochaetia bacterium]|nr:hypothetical protein FACS1894200_13060 [Spirochaetia bacterium]
MRKSSCVAAFIERHISADMVRIQGGTFTMGSLANEAGRWDNEGPQHKVTLSGFSMSKTEVTQKDYQALMGSNPKLSTQPLPATHLRVALPQWMG